MDVIVSTSKNPYKKIWEKRGSKYIDDDEFSNIVKQLSPFYFIGCEKNEMIGSSIPMFCTEDLESILCTESTDETVDDIIDDTDTSNEKTFIKLTKFDIKCK